MATPMWIHMRMCRSLGAAAQMLTTVKVLSLPDPTMIRGRSLALLQSFEAARYMTAIF